MRRTLAIAKKEVKHLFRDPRRLYLSFVIPLMMLLIFGYAIKFDVEDVLVGFCNLDNGSYGEKLIDWIPGSGLFSVSLLTRSFKELESKIGKGSVEIGVVIPPNFTKRIKRNETTDVQIIIDASNPTVARLGTSYIQSIIKGFYGSDSRQYEKGIKINYRILYNLELKSTNFVVPGLIAVIMTMISCLLTSLTIAGEWEKGTMEVLLTTPVRSSELILGKILPYIVIAFIDILVIVFVSVFIFNVPFRGSLFLLFLSTFVFLTGGLGVGILISTLIKREQLVIQIAWLVTILPSLLLSGFMFPIESMPKIIQLVTYLNPARYFIVIIRSIMLKGTGFLSFNTEFVFLLIYGILILGLSIIVFNRERG